MMKRTLMTPIRRLEGITYWVIEDPDGIRDFINKEIRKEWEEDARSEGRDPQKDQWLKILSKVKWSLKISEIDRIKLNPNIMNYADSKRGYNFQEELAKRCQELQRGIEQFNLVIWPVIVKKEDFMLVDGYCRFSTLKSMKVSRVYTYVGEL